MIREIVQLCREMDATAQSLYERFHRESPTADLRRFWLGLAQEEERHVGYWEHILPLAERDALPQVFDDPEAVHRELTLNLTKARSLPTDPHSPGSQRENLLAAYRMEYFLLHSAFFTIFRFMDTVYPVKSPSRDYEHHLLKFARAFNRQGQGIPELELLGETLLRLWHETHITAMHGFTDFLTGTFNRRGLTQAMLPLAYLAARERFDVGVLMIDLDDFKGVNDRHGHIFGDTALTEVAERIRKQLRRSDLLGRYGGDEFLVFLPKVNADALRRIATRIRKSIEQNPLEGITLTVSIGLAGSEMGDDPPRQFKELVSLADKALYQAKSTGKNRVIG